MTTTTEKPGCKILECGRRPIAAHGMCWGHYARDRRGDPLYVHIREEDGRAAVVKYGPARPPRSVLREAGFRLDLSERLVTPEPNTGCWLWLGLFNKVTGYGTIGNGNDPWGRHAHRAVLHFAGVELERDNLKRCVRHLCDNRACVNPAHLAYGTAQENVDDRSARYRREGRRGWQRASVIGPVAEVIP